MAEITRLWIVTLTRNKPDAGTEAGQLDLTINIDGIDVVDRNIKFMQGSGPLSNGLGPDNAWLGRAQAAVADLKLETPIESSLLTNSSIRLGIRSGDLWAPEHVLILGQAPRRVIALAMETDLGVRLSTDSEEGKLTIPLRLVGSGSSTTTIQRVMLIVYTQNGTDDPLQLQISTASGIVADTTIVDTTQDDFEEYAANWHIRPVAAPFTRSDVLSGGAIQLGIQGQDAWRPYSVFVYGLDTATGRPNEVVDLVAIPEWTLPALSTDPAEGQPTVLLPVM
jgi:hypothetical protein